MFQLFNFFNQETKLQQDSIVKQDPINKSIREKFRKATKKINLFYHKSDPPIFLYIWRQYGLTICAGIVLNFGIYFLNRYIIDSNCDFRDVKKTVIYCHDSFDEIVQKTRSFVIYRIPYTYYVVHQFTENFQMTPIYQYLNWIVLSTIFGTWGYITLLDFPTYVWCHIYWSFALILYQKLFKKLGIIYQFRRIYFYYILNIVNLYYSEYWKLQGPEGKYLMNFFRLFLTKQLMKLALMDKLKFNVKQKEEIKLTIIMVYTVDIGTSHNKLFKPNMTEEDIFWILFQVWLVTCFNLTNIHPVFWVLAKIVDIVKFISQKLRIESIFQFMMFFIDKLFILKHLSQCFGRSTMYFQKKLDEISGIKMVVDPRVLAYNERKAQTTLGSFYVISFIQITINYLFTVIPQCYFPQQNQFSYYKNKMSLKKGYMPIAKTVHDITYLKILYEVAVFIGVFGSVLLYQKITKTKILGTHFDFNNKPLFFFINDVDILL